MERNSSGWMTAIPLKSSPSRKIRSKHFGAWAERKNWGIVSSRKEKWIATARNAVTKRAVSSLSPAPILLDTSALLAFIEDEAGADRVEEALKREKIILPWPVLLETYYITLQNNGPAEADRRFALIKQLKAEFLWDMDEAVLLTASGLKARFRISLADAIIAAYALSKGAVLLHKDPEFDSLAEMLPLETLPYKSS
jgi:predicted nucleic acid-binding protein